MKRTFKSGKVGDGVALNSVAHRPGELEKVVRGLVKSGAIRYANNVVRVGGRHCVVVVRQKTPVIRSAFGMAPVKAEGKSVKFDAGYKSKKGGKRPVGNDWMELPIPKNMGRARVHKMVDEWLNVRAAAARNGHKHLLERGAVRAACRRGA